RPPDRSRPGTREERLEAAGAVQRHHVVVAADVDVAHEALRDRRAPRPRNHARAGLGVEADPHLVPLQAAAAEEVLGGNAVAAHGAGVQGDRRGGLAVQRVLRKLAGVPAVHCGDGHRRLQHTRVARCVAAAWINEVFTPRRRRPRILSPLLPRDPAKPACACPRLPSPSPSRWPRPAPRRRPSSACRTSGPPPTPCSTPPSSASTGRCCWPSCATTTTSSTTRSWTAGCARWAAAWRQPATSPSSPSPSS